MWFVLVRWRCCLRRGCDALIFWFQSNACDERRLPRIPSECLCAPCLSGRDTTRAQGSLGRGRIACVWVLLCDVWFLYIFWRKTFLWYIIFVGVFFFFFRVVFFKCQGSDSVRTGLNQLFTLRRCSEYYFSQPLKLRKSCLKGFRTRSAFFFFFGQIVSPLREEV